MTGPTFSPDGQFMWTGSEWIPSPPKSEIIPQSTLDKNDINLAAEQFGVDSDQLTATSPYFDQNKDGVLQQSELQQAAMSISQKPTNIHAKRGKRGKKSISNVGIIGCFLIMFSLFLPYIDLGFIVRMSGLELLLEYGEAANELGASGGDLGSGGDSPLGIEEWSLILFGIFPIVNLFFGGISFIFALFKARLRSAGIFYCIFSAALLFTAISSGLTDIWGVGVWIAIAGGVVLLFDNKK